MNVLVFAGLADAVGGSSIRLDIALPAHVADVKRAIEYQFPSAKPILAGCFAAVNHIFAGDEILVHEGDEVAFLPPVSGG
jgi:molybdopterin converting factor small subunit